MKTTIPFLNTTYDLKFPRLTYGSRVFGPGLVFLSVGDPPPPPTSSKSDRFLPDVIGVVPDIPSSFINPLPGVLSAGL